MWTADSTATIGLRTYVARHLEGAWPPSLDAFKKGGTVSGNGWRLLPSPASVETLCYPQAWAWGVEDSNLFTDVLTGAQADRPSLTAMLAAAGDTIVMWRLDRLGWSVLHLADLAEQLRKRGVGLRSLSDGVDTSTIGGRLLYGLLSVLQEFERETIKDEVRAGVAAARRAGIHCGRRPALKPEQVAYARTRLAAGETVRHIANFLDVSEATLSRSLARHSAPALKAA